MVALAKFQNWLCGVRGHQRLFPGLVVLFIKAMAFDRWCILACCVARRLNTLVFALRTPCAPGEAPRRSWCVTLFTNSTTKGTVAEVCRRISFGCCTGAGALWHLAIRRLRPPGTAWESISTVGRVNGGHRRVPAMLMVHAFLYGKLVGKVNTEIPRRRTA